MAISLLPDELGEYSFDFAAKTAHMLAETIIENNLPNGITLNINIPPPPIKGIKVAKLGEKRYNPEIIIKKDPRDRIYYWLGTGNPKPSETPRVMS